MKQPELFLSWRMDIQSIEAIAMQQASQLGGQCCSQVQWCKVFTKAAPDCDVETAKESVVSSAHLKPKGAPPPIERVSENSGS